MDPDVRPLCSGFGHSPVDDQLTACRHSSHCATWPATAPTTGIQGTADIACVSAGQHHTESVLILVDAGGTCSSCAVANKLRERLGGRVCVVTGLNLEMLATAPCHPSGDIVGFAAHVAKRGAESAAVA